MGAASSTAVKKTKRNCGKDSKNSLRCWNLGACHRNSSSSDAYCTENESLSQNCQKPEMNGVINKSPLPTSFTTKEPIQEIDADPTSGTTWQQDSGVETNRNFGLLQLDGNNMHTYDNFVMTPTSCDAPSTPASFLAIPSAHYDPSITSYSEYSLKTCGEYTLTEHTQDMLLQIIKCFPFPSPKPSRRNTEKSISPQVPMHEPELFQTTPSTSDEKENMNSAAPSSPATTTAQQATHNHFKKNKISTGFTNFLNRHRAVHRVKSDNGAHALQGRPHSASTTSANSAPALGEGGDQSHQSTMRGALSKLCQTPCDPPLMLFFIASYTSTEPPQKFYDETHKHIYDFDSKYSKLCLCTSSRESQLDQVVEKTPSRRGLPKLKNFVKRRRSPSPQNFDSTCTTFTEVYSSVSPAEACLLDHFVNMKLINTPDSTGSKTMFSRILRKSLLQVSVDTMAITALPLDCWLKERLRNWVQLSGHEGSIVPATNYSLYKKQPSNNLNEAKAYQEIMKDRNLSGLTPVFYKEITHKNESFIEIQDLLSEFPNTSTRAIMDIKIGTRTFLESEVLNATKRPDLYKKMVDLDPNEPTEEEKQEQAITKLRYMQFRERESSSASLGFRIEAAQLPTGKLQRSFKKIKTKDQICETLEKFFDGRVEELCQQTLARLKEIRLGVEKSEFFRTHEVVGSSLLIVYDESKLSTWMIDFAKTTKVPDDIELNHRAEWSLGNHEDGYLTGLDNLINVLEECATKKNLVENGDATS